ncbi:MAG: FAD-dependent oxidoreductase, partial [candidate division Zixibacteria bacterium]|nr:FAD-dependent oxidoreductase [candidate division Zixibacteria bacterium]
DTEHLVKLDTLIVAISEDTGIETVTSADDQQIELTKWNTIKTDSKTHQSSQPGVFAAGDVTRGPDTVINAIADGKRSAIMIDRYIRGDNLAIPAESKLPEVYIASSENNDSDEVSTNRVKIEHTPAKKRKSDFKEVEICLTNKSATCEARRCLRCDLEFTQPKEDENKIKEKANSNKASTGVNVK